MNKKLALELATFTETYPHNFDMRSWYGYRAVSSHCGYTACLAGNLLVMVGEYESNEVAANDYRLRHLEVGVRACELLDLPSNLAPYLFTEYNWLSEDHRQDYWIAENEGDLDGLAFVAADYVRWFVDNYEEILQNENDVDEE